MNASGGGRIPEPPKVAAVTTEAQQRRRAVLILYCTLTLSHYALRLVSQGFFQLGMGEILIKIY